MTNDDIRRMIEAGIANAEVEVSGDGTHFYARVVSDAFAGLPMLKQHRMVYAALGSKMEGAIHALSIETFTRDAWERARTLKVQ